MLSASAAADLRGNVALLTRIMMLPLAAGFANQGHSNQRQKILSFRFSRFPAELIILSCAKNEILE
jgi:hypothetical protein